ncbi:MAG: hypothetical protein ACFCU1_10135 [Sumerlaeia bacterium]
MLTPSKRGPSSAEKFTLNLNGGEALQLFLVFFFYFIYAFNPTWLYDDAYFFVRYAENILNGHGYTWNAGQPPVDGLTSPLWLVVVLVGMLLTPVEAAHSGYLLVVLSTSFSLLLIFLIYYCLRYFLPIQARSLAILGPLFFVLTDVNLIVAGQSGMETALSACMLVGFMWLAASYQQEDEAGVIPLPTAILLGVFGFLLVLARPEFGLVAGLCPLILFVTLFAKRSPATRGVFYWGYTTALLLIFYGVIRIFVFNDLFPQSFYIKGSIWNSPYDDFNAGELQSLAKYSYMFLRESAVLHLLIFYALCQRRLWLRYLWIWLPLYACMLYLSFSIQIMGYLHRYYFPFACGLVALIGLLYGRLVKEGVFSFHWVHTHAVNRAVFIGLILYICATTYLPQTQLRSFKRTYDSHDFRVAKIFNNLPDGTRVVATELGIIAANNPHLEFIDITGLNDRTFAQGFDAAELFARKPDVFTLIHHHYGGINRDIMQHPRFRREYIPIRKLNPSGETFKLDNTIFIWKNSPNYKQILRALLTTPEPVFE